MGADSTQYLIDIAIKMAGAPDATSALVDLGAKMVETGASAQALDAAVVSAKAALEQSAAAASAAASAVSEGQAAYNAAEIGAQKAARAAEKLGNDVQAAAAKLASMRDADTGELGAGYLAAAGKLRSLQDAQGAAQAKSTALAGALEQEGAALDALKAKAAAAQEEHEQMADGIGALEQGAKKAAAAEKATAGSGNVNELAEAFGRLGGPVGSAGQKLFGFADGLKKMAGGAGSGIGMVLGLTVAVVALGAALVAGAVGIASWAVGLADTGRNARLATDALAASDKAFAGIDKTLQSVGDSTGLSSEHLVGLAKQLRDAKVSAADMPAALKAAALAEAALGQGAAAKLVEDLKAGKKSAGALADEMQRKFGGIVAKKMLSLDAQALTLKKNLGETFGGLNIEGLLGGLAKLVGLLDSSSSSGKAIKFIFESLFQPLIDAAVRAGPSVERFFLGIILGALKMYNAFKPAIRAVRELSDAAGEGEGSWDWLDVGVGIAYGVAAALTVLAVVVGAAVAPFVYFFDQVMTVWSGLSAIDWGAIGSAIMGALEGIDLASVGSAIIDGLVSGLLGGLPGVISSMLSIGDAAIAALKSKLSINSPSKVFEGLGGFTAEGFAQGVEGGTGDARAALETMVEPPSAAAPGAPAGAGAAATGAGLSLHIDTVNVNGGPKEAALDFVDQVMVLLEGKVLQSGAGRLAPAGG